jgi:hypothetical protein
VVDDGRRNGRLLIHDSERHNNIAMDYHRQFRRTVPRCPTLASQARVKNDLAVQNSR